MAANYVKFIRGTPKAFANLAVKDSDTLYFITEAESADGVLYLGSKKIGGTGNLSTSSIDELRDVLISNDLSDRSFLIYDAVQKQWINKSFDELCPIFKGATATLPGVPGFVPAPQAGDVSKFLRSDGTWAAIQGGGSGGISAVDGTFFTLEDSTLGLKDLPISKITGLEAKLQNTISAVDGTFFEVKDSTLTLKNVSISKVEGLQSALDNKVEKQEGARLITEVEGNKLNSLLGITAVSSDFTFTDGVLGFSHKFNQEMQQTQETVATLDKKVADIEEAISWTDL